jgi:hypothetical protein
MPDLSAQVQAISTATLEGFLLELQIREMLVDDNISLWSGEDEDSAAENIGVKTTEKSKVQQEKELKSDAVQLGGVNEALLSRAAIASVDRPNNDQQQHQALPDDDEYSESRMYNSRHRTESTITASTTRASTDRETNFTGRDAQPQFARDRVPRAVHSNPLIQEIAEHNPDMILDFPNVSVDELEMELHNFTARVTVEGSVGNLVKVCTGVNVNVGDLSVSMKGVQASALLVGRLDNLKEVLGKAIDAAMQNPDLLDARTARAEEPQP